MSALHPFRTEPISPQERVKCACPSLSSARACIDARYGRQSPGGDDCGCVCHLTVDEAFGDIDEEEGR